MVFVVRTAVELVEEPDFHFHANRRSHHLAAAQQPSKHDKTLLHGNSQ